MSIVDPLEDLLDVAYNIQDIFEGKADGRHCFRKPRVIMHERDVPRTWPACSWVADLIRAIKRVQRRRPDLERFDFTRFSVARGDDGVAWLLRCVTETDRWLGLTVLESLDAEELVVRGAGPSDCSHPSSPRSGSPA